jgi:hypothetical protein
MIRRCEPESIYSAPDAKSVDQKERTPHFVGFSHNALRVHEPGVLLDDCKSAIDRIQPRAVVLLHFGYLFEQAGMMRQNLGVVLQDRRMAR